jgi:type IV pilus assembly protein PilP
MRTLGKIFVLFVSGFGLTGCVDWVEDTQDLVSFVNEAKRTPGGRIEPLPEFKPYQSFVYKGASMREPFIALLPEVQLSEEELSAELAGNGLQPDNEREKSYLESFPIDELRMVGTITGREDSRLWALVRDSNAEIHRVAEGDYMGLDFGEITLLNEHGIQLVEIVKNGRGGWMKRSRSIALDEQE